MNKSANILNVLKYFPIVLIVILIIILYKGNIHRPTIDTDTVPDVTFPGLVREKDNLVLKNLQGKRYVLQFFATWCGYCMDEYQAFLKLEKKIPIYGVLWSDDPENGRILISEKANPFINIGIDPYGVVSKKFNISVIPQTFVIDEKGRIIFHRIGAFDPKYLLKYF